MLRTYSDDKEAKKLLLSKKQYHIAEGVLYYVEADKLYVMFHWWVIVNICLKRHFSAHLQDAKVHGELSKHYWWPKLFLGGVRVVWYVSPVNLVDVCSLPR